MSYTLLQDPKLYRLLYAIDQELAAVRYLGRRVYLAAVIVLASVMQCGVTDRRTTQINQLFPVPRRTLDRWRQWWSNAFLARRAWPSAAASGRTHPTCELVMVPPSWQFFVLARSQKEKAFF